MQLRKMCASINLGECQREVAVCTYVQGRRRKEKKNYAGSKTLPASYGKGDTLAQSAVSLPHQGRRK